jgi:peroxiredoxin Q/BCP
MISVGDQFPAFSLQNQDGETMTNADFAGAPALFYFYPKDDTSGCTTEACGFRDAFPRFEGVRVAGISPDSAKSHRKFADKYSLPFTLLADEGHKLAEACGVWVEKEMYGKKYMGVQRASFLVDAGGKVTKVWPKVTPAGHPGEVLAALAASARK